MRADRPLPRGPISEALFAGWAGGRWQRPPCEQVDALTDDDLHLALWCSYQLHYGGFDGVPDDLEWDPDHLVFRADLEDAFEAALRAEHRPDDLPGDPATALRVIAEWSSPPLASELSERGERWQLVEMAVHRSAYQLKEGDGHTWAIPRLAGRTKAAVVEIQFDEYGSGVADDAHAHLFARALDELGLDTTFGRYVDRLPGTTLATDNLLSMFGLHHRLRGALVGHLAHFEMCSSQPMAQYLRAADRFGLAAMARFFEVHVVADLRHGQLALTEAVEPLVLEEPNLASDITFGAGALHHVEARFAHHLLASWAAGRSSLLDTRFPTAVRSA